jgi:hypothetical protein
MESGRADWIVSPNPAFPASRLSILIPLAAEQQLTNAISRAKPATSCQVSMFVAWIKYSMADLASLGDVT